MLGSTPKHPLFITGHPRSGTTLMRLLFNNHPSLAIPDETGMFHWFYKRPWYKKFTRSRIPIPSPKSHAFGQAVVARYNALPLTTRNNPKASMDYLYGQVAQEQGKPFWGDKTPLHTQFTDQIFALYPQAYVVYMVRDPRAVAGSAKRNLGHKRKGTDFWISADLQLTIARWKAEYERIRHYHAQYPLSTEILKYEDLVADPRAVLGHICRRMGLEFSNDMLEYYKERQQDVNNLTTWHLETAKPVNQDNLEKWIRELDAAEIAEIEQSLENPMRESGYLPLAPMDAYIKP
jgi:hypothetical protein